MYEINLAKDLIKIAGLDLNNLIVYTELASHNYFYNAFIPVLAGAKQVIVQANDNNYSKAELLIEEGKKIASLFNFQDKMIFVKGKRYDYLSKSDIITNSGNIRPFDKQLIDALKKTAVIPLMWETWELREDELDLEYCKKKEILVLGTNEECKNFSMKKYIGLGALKLLLNSGYDGGKIILIGSDTILTRGIFELLKKLKIEVKWINDLEDSLKIKNIFNDNYNYSHIFIAEHLKKILIIGNQGLLNINKINSINRYTKICIMAGYVDQKYMEENKLDFYPKSIAPFGHLSYQLSELGSRPIMSLFVYGLKVGEQMAKLRIKGMTIKETLQIVLKNDLAMNFFGENAW